MPSFNENKKKGFGFVSKRTLGKTNEISFSVLDGKLEESEKKQQDPWDIQGSDLVKLRRRSRRRGKLIVGLSAVAGVLILGTLIIFGIAGFIQNSNGTNDHLNSLISQSYKEVEDNSQVRSAISTILNNEASTIANSLTSSDLESLKDQSFKKKQKLEKMKNDLEETLTEIAIPSDKNNGNNALDFINNEIDICIFFSEICSNYADDYLKDRENAVRAMKMIIAGDSADREASALLLQGNVEVAESSKTKIQEAQNYDIQARSCFESMSKSRRSQFEDYIEFCQLRIDAQDASLKVAQAYVDRNKEELETQNNIYNQKQDDATKIAEGWSKQPSEILDEELGSLRSQDSEKYKTLNDKYISYQKTIKEYLKM